MHILETTTGKTATTGTVTSSGTAGTPGTPGTSGTSGTPGTSGTGSSLETSGTTITAATGSPSGTSGTGSTQITAATSATTTEECQEMQAVDKFVSEKITVTPHELPKGENTEFQSTSTRGVSFREDDKTPIITVYFEKGAKVRSVTIVLTRIPNANVQQFSITFYSRGDKKINEKPILSNLSPKDDKNQPAHLDSTQIPPHIYVYKVVITLLRTTDNKSPKGVTLDIIACTEASTG